VSGRPVLRLVLAGAGARLGYAVLGRRPPGGEQTWTRTNHRGEQVSLLEGPAVAAGAVAAAAAVPGLDAAARAALMLAGTAACAVGCYDDLAGDAGKHGFHGHLGALAKGEITTGTAKIAGIGAASLTASLVLAGRAERPAAGVTGTAADVAINTGLVAGAANLLNLFDLRPGRAIKVTTLAGAALAAGGPRARAAAVAPVGAALALLPDDLGEQSMLGDAGANALGAMLGVAAASALPRGARIAVLAGIAGLTAASEKISFTKVIERTRPLRWLDMLGRRPAPGRARSDGGRQAGAIGDQERPPAGGSPAGADGSHDAAVARTPLQP